MADRNIINPGAGPVDIPDVDDFAARLDDDLIRPCPACGTSWFTHDEYCAPKDSR